MWQYQDDRLKKFNSMDDVPYMIGPGLSFFRSTDDLTVTFNATRPKVVDFELKLYDIFVPILGILIILINGLVVISSGLIIHQGQQPRTTYMFLGNVALADLIIGFAVLFGLCYPPSKRTEIVCAIEIGMTVSATIASAYCVGLIAIDRFLYILCGLRYQHFIYPNRARLMVASVWILALIVGFLPAMGYRGETNNGQLCWFIVIEPPELILATTTVGLIPLVLVIVLYSIILYHALKKISQLKSAAESARGIQSGNLRVFRGGIPSDPIALSVIPDSQQSNGDAENLEAPLRGCCGLRKRNSRKAQITVVYNPSRWKAIKIVAFTTGCFFVTWFPYFVASALHTVCNPHETPRFCDTLRVALASPLAILGLSNSLLNPLIYAWWHNGFRDSLRKIWKNSCGMNRTFCNPDSSTDSRSQLHTRSTFYRISGQGADAEASDNERNPIVRSKLIMGGQEMLQEIGAQSLNYDLSRDTSGSQRIIDQSNSDVN